MNIRVVTPAEESNKRLANVSTLEQEIGYHRSVLHVFIRHDAKEVWSDNAYNVSVHTTRLKRGRGIAMAERCEFMGSEFWPSNDMNTSM